MKVPRNFPNPRRRTRHHRNPQQKKYNYTTHTHTRPSRAYRTYVRKNGTNASSRKKRFHARIFRIGHPLKQGTDTPSPPPRGQNRNIPPPLPPSPHSHPTRAQIQFVFTFFIFLELLGDLCPLSPSPYAPPWKGEHRLKRQTNTGSEKSAAAVFSSCARVSLVPPPRPRSCSGAEQQAGLRHRVNYMARADRI